MNVDGHPHQEENMADQEPGVVEPREIVVDIVSEVSSLEVAIHQTD